MPDPLNPALRAVSDAVLAVAAQRSVEDVLQQLVDSARELAGARYAALGTPDGEGGFTRFLVAGMSDELIAALGPLPRRHGMLGVMLETSEPYMTEDIHAHPRFRGWWPSAHPDMRSFLGVPIVAPEGVIGAFYLTEKESGEPFDAADQAVIELLAAHAAIAITDAGLNERSRELSMLEARNRVALELHDAVSQKLFSLVLTAEAAGTQLERDPGAARAHVERLRALAQRGAGGAALADPRAAPARARARRALRRAAQARRDAAAAAPRGDRRRHRRLGRRARRSRAAARAGAAPPRAAARATGRSCASRRRRCRTRSATARRTASACGSAAATGGSSSRSPTTAPGFDPAEPELRSRRLGLTSMEERAQRLGGTLSIRSAPGEGTTVRLEAPGG